MRTLRTDQHHPDFVLLVSKLDAELEGINGADHAFYAPLNTADDLNWVVVAYENDVPVSCGAFKKFDAETVEIKRMYTLPNHRGKGLAKLVLKDLESWAASIKVQRIVLETGKTLPSAVQLYQNRGYDIIPAYPPYQDDPNSLCFEKVIESGISSR